MLVKSNAWSEVQCMRNECCDSWVLCTMSTVCNECCVQWVLYASDVCLPESFPVSSTLNDIIWIDNNDFNISESAPVLHTYLERNNSWHSNKLFVDVLAVWTTICIFPFMRNWSKKVYQIWRDTSTISQTDPTNPKHWFINCAKFFWCFLLIPLSKKKDNCVQYQVSKYRRKKHGQHY